MSIILTILKIIGISILIILGILILLILLVLFVPLRYKAAGSYVQEGIDVSGKVRWLMGVVSLTAQYKNGQPFHIKAKVFFITVFDNLKKRKKSKKERKRKRISDEEPQLQAASSTNDEPIDDETMQEERSIEEAASEEIKKETEIEEDFVQGNSQTTEQGAKRTADEVEIDQANDDKADKNKLFQRIKDFLKKLVEVLRNIKFTFHKIYDIIVKIRDNIKYYWELLQQESTKQALGLCTKRLSKIIKNISPQKYEVKLHLGFEDPATMGNVLAVWGILYPFHMGNVDIQPEFDKKIMEGSFRLKGKMSIYIFLWTLWLLITDKNIKQLRKQLDL
ncbi:MAG: hypothetical protein HDR25_02290 [Lachnospiraceae bacterium]|nr:hypothetical protein [Lachnospiraceae bacterium]